MKEKASIRRTARRRWLQNHAKRSLRHRVRRRSLKRRSRNFGQKPPPRVFPEIDSAEVYIPEHLSVTDNLEETLSFFNELERCFFEKKAKVVTVDHTRLKRITPDAALLLIAEFDRLTFHAKLTKLRARGHSSAIEVEDMLNGIGYNNYFSMKKDRSRTYSSTQTPGLTYIRHQFGNQTMPEEVDQLVEHFKTLVKFSPRRAERLTESLGECMTNVGIHAYPQHRKKEFRWGHMRWWLVGYTDQSCREIYFAFLDQGIGMPSTLKRKFVEKLLIPLSDPELIKMAFTEARSSTGLKFRGRGLPTLKRYIDEAPDGELVVQTGQVRCAFSPGARANAKKTDLGLAGTLLVWHVKSSDADHGGE